MTYEEILAEARLLSEVEQYKLCDTLIDGFTPSMQTAIRYNPDAQAAQEGIRRSHRERINDGDLTEQEKRDMNHRENFRPFG